MPIVAAILGLLGAATTVGAGLWALALRPDGIAALGPAIAANFHNLGQVFVWNADPAMVWTAFFGLAPVFALLGAAFVLWRPGIGVFFFITSALGLLGLFAKVFLARTTPVPLTLLIAAAFLLVAAAGIVAVTITSSYEKGPGVRRHSVVVRVTHWINAFAILVLLMSGLQIFNAHPALYWGHTSKFDDQGWYKDTVLQMRPINGPDGGKPIGITKIGNWTIETTGLFGATWTTNARGEEVPIFHGFPYWATLPAGQDLATGRLWHFLFAWIFVINGIVYAGWTLASRHIRDLVPTGRDWRGFGRTVRQHLLLRWPRGEEARRYNIIQQITYLGLFVVILVLIVAGLAMSPALNAAFHWLPELFGGRQGARTVHFICAALIVLFVIVHVAVVLISGVRNNLRSMVTGRYLLGEERHES